MMLSHLKRLLTPLNTFHIPFDLTQFDRTFASCSAEAEFLRLHKSKAFGKHKCALLHGQVMGCKGVGS